jgi:DNA processing protein
MLTLDHSELPGKLQNIGEPPKKLYILGEDIRKFDKLPHIAIVGARAISPYGRAVTNDIARELTRAGIVIVSGLALGVDSIAHSAVLDARGLTIAVIPSGIKKIYPRSHEALARKIIASGGSVISEHDGDFLPAKYDFLIRNRLVAGLADAVIVTEAAERSGTLNTVKHALDQGKPVFAVPGNISSPMSAGTNHLLKLGAHPLTSAQDVFEVMDWQSLQSQPQKVSYRGTETEMQILSAIQGGATSIAEIVKGTSLGTAVIQRDLTMLELAGVVQSQSGLWRIHL